MRTSDSHITTDTKLKRIAWLSSKDRHKVFDNVMHLVNQESLEICFHELRGKKATGTDEVTKEEYGRELSANLDKLVHRLKAMSYKPGNIRVVEIPKEGNSGKTRPLGISNFEDKLFQKIVGKILESIYEPLFLECSYGFRPGRGCHDAIRALRQYLYGNEVSTVIDVDLANYFGQINHELLQSIISKKIRDKKFRRYLSRMLKAGYLKQGELSVSEEGVAQGSIASPILSNIFAHEVIDSWFEEVVKQHCRGRVELFRYADDAVICCQYERDAERVKTALAKRLAKYGLLMNEDKTRMVKFSRQAYQQGVRVESFDFLGFTYYWGKSLKGTCLPKVKSSGKRMRIKLKRINEWAKKNRNIHPTLHFWESFCTKIAGHIRYYGVSFNTVAMKRFIHRATRIMFKWLNRRSQRRSWTWEQFDAFQGRYPLPVAKIYHRLW
jgi:RNA-directed DNA polymerase